MHDEPVAPHTLPKVSMNRKRVSIVCNLEPEDVDRWQDTTGLGAASPLGSYEGSFPGSPTNADPGSPTNVNRVVRKLLLAKKVIKQQSDAVAELQQCSSGLANEIEECGPAWEDDYFTFLRRNIRSKSLTALSAVLPEPRNEIVPSPMATSRSKQLVVRTPKPPAAPRPDETEVMKREWHFSPEKKVDYGALLMEQQQDLKKGQENHQQYNRLLKVISGERNVQMAKFEEYTKEDVNDD